MMQHVADTPGIRIGSTTDPHPEIAAAALRHQLGQEGMGLAVVFASSRYDLEALAGCLRREFGPVPVVGCTTAGEIGPLGYTEGGLSGFSLAEDEVTVEIGLIDGVSGLQNRRGQAFAYGLRPAAAPRRPPGRIRHRQLLRPAAGGRVVPARGERGAGAARRAGRDSAGGRIGRGRPRLPPHRGPLRRTLPQRRRLAAGGLDTVPRHDLQDPALRLRLAPPGGHRRPAGAAHRHRDRRLPRRRGIRPRRRAGPGPAQPHGVFRPPHGGQGRRRRFRPLGPEGQPGRQHDFLLRHRRGYRLQRRRKASTWSPT